MILVDVNLLVYAKMASLPAHRPSLTWLEARLGEVGGVAMPWASLLGFVRLTSNPRIFERPLTVDGAWRQVEEWLALPNVYAPEPAGRYPQILRALMARVTRPEQVPDAHLAALAIEYGLMLCTTDRDFARFAGLRWENPLEG